MENEKRILIVEPFYGGSHKQLIDFLTEYIPKAELVTLPAKKWHWRARTSALYLSQVISKTFSRDILFCSSVLNLCELCSLRPDLSQIPKKIVYFHENQLVYPKQNTKNRDFQYGYNQICTCIVADTILFNSHFNLDSFLDNIGSFLKLQPDFKPDVSVLKQQILDKSKVLYFPIKLPKHRSLLKRFENPESPEKRENPEKPEKTEIPEKHENTEKNGNTENTEKPENPEKDENPENLEKTEIPENPEKPEKSEKPLHILWPHRWEHDKNPEDFFQTLFKLKQENLNFELSILGENFDDVPEVFNRAKVELKQEIRHFGWLENREKYFEILHEADVVISTANHEFFGVAMLESAASGCLPLVPDRLVYPEIYPESCIYRTQQQLFKKLKSYCQKPHLAQHHWTRDKAEETCLKYSTESMLSSYLELFE